MNTTSENIIMTISEIPAELTRPKLTRVVSAEIDFTAFPYCREEEVEKLGTPVAPQLETQVSAEIDWTSWPYCLSFSEEEFQVPPVAPQLETQVSAEIDWTSWPYCLSFNK
jgi:hypothetical protein